MQVLGVMAGKSEFKYTVRPFTPEDITNQSHLQPGHKVVVTILLLILLQGCYNINACFNQGCKPPFHCRKTPTL